MLADFRQPRCVPVILDVLGNDPDPLIRAAAAVRLERFSDDKVKAALLKALDGEPRVAQAAAWSLAGLQVEEAIQPTRRLLLSDERELDRNYLIRALARYPHKRAVAVLHDLLGRFSASKADADKSVAGGIRRALKRLEDKEPSQDDPTNLAFRVSLDAKTYRVGNPVAVDLAVENRSDRPFLTFPLASLERMAYAVRLERIGEPAWVLVNCPPVVASERARETFLSLSGASTRRDFLPSRVSAFLADGGGTWLLALA